MKSCSVIPDSSFFICFLDDIARPEYLVSIVCCVDLEFFTGNIIQSEIEIHCCDSNVQRVLQKNVKKFQYYAYGEILKPFFSKKEIKKGEHEVIVISYILNYTGDKFVAILDDNPAKKYLKRLIPDKGSDVTGTVGFIERLTNSYAIFKREEAIQILALIKDSKFRIETNIIDGVIDRLNRKGA
jgi:predicted nucleic acid-binding protein